MPHLRITVKPFSSAEKLWYFLLLSALVEANFHILPLTRLFQKNTFQAICAVVPYWSLPKPVPWMLWASLLFCLLVGGELVRDDVWHTRKPTGSVCCEQCSSPGADEAGQGQRWETFVWGSSLSALWSWVQKYRMRADSWDKNPCFCPWFPWSLGKSDTGLQSGLCWFGRQQRAKEISRQFSHPPSQNDAGLMHKKAPKNNVSKDAFLPILNLRSYNTGRFFNNFRLMEPWYYTHLSPYCSSLPTFWL